MSTLDCTECGCPIDRCNRYRPNRKCCPDCKHLHPTGDPVSWPGKGDGKPPPLEDDRTAMMLGLVPDKRTPQERLLDAIDSNGESLNYRYNPETGTSEKLT